MGTNQADIRLVELYTMEDYMKDLSENTLLKSGLVKTSKTIKEKINAADFGLSLRLPYIPSQAFDEGEIVDDSTNEIQGTGIVFGHMTAALNNRAKAWDFANITEQVKPGLKLTDIVVREGQRWHNKMLEKILEASLDGVIASNIANEGGDIVLDNGTDAIDWSTIVKARNLAHKQTFNHIVMGIDVASVLEVKYPELYMRKDKVLGYGMDTFGGMKVIISDTLGAEADAKKTVYLLSDGAIIQDFKDIDGTIGSAGPFKLVENKAAGMGGGNKKFIFNMAEVTHVDGYSYSVAPTKTNGYTLAELANPALYTRVAPQENTGIVAIKTEAK